MIVDRDRKPRRRPGDLARAVIFAALAGVLLLVGCTAPAAVPTGTAVETPAAVESPLPAGSAGAPTAAPKSAPAIAPPLPTPTPDVVLDAVAGLTPAERLDDRTAASADWPLVAVPPDRQPTPEPKTVEQTVTHVVAKGETLSKIANARGVSVDAIVRFNKLGDGSMLTVGQRLEIPTGKQTTVYEGDRLAATLEPRFIWPARGPISTYFGERGSIWRDGWHTGLDIAANFGMPIVAAESGVVLEAGWATTRGFGNYVKIDHGLGYHTLYGHMSVIRAKEGQWVNRGDRIGDIGSTGVSTGPHLHLEVRLNGQVVNPLPYLPKSQ